MVSELIPRSIGRFSRSRDRRCLRLNLRRMSRRSMRSCLRSNARRECDRSTPPTSERSFDERPLISPDCLRLRLRLMRFSRTSRLRASIKSLTVFWLRQRMASVGGGIGSTSRGMRTRRVMVRTIRCEKRSSTATGSSILSTPISRLMSSFASRSRGTFSRRPDLPSSTPTASPRRGFSRSASGMAMPRIPTISISTSPTRLIRSGVRCWGCRLDVLAVMTTNTTRLPCRITTVFMAS